VRVSLKTNDVQRANRKLIEMEANPSAARPRKSIADAVGAFLERHANTAAETQRKYRCVLGRIRDGLAKVGVDYADQISVDALGAYAAAHEKQNWTWLKELELLKQFIGFCARREWCKVLDLDELKRPRLEEANQVVPYTVDQVVNILAACDRLGRTNYERSRARAMVLLMRHAGLRVSDVVTLSREHVTGNRLVKRAVKNRKWINVELPSAVVEALDRLPQPKAAPQDCRLYFASGQASVRSLVKGAQRTMAVVFERAAVPDGHCHRFRHTLATELKGKGATDEEIAGILADSPATIRRHYAKWSPEFQIRQDEVLRRIHGTYLAQAEEQLKSC
jgi:integrase